MIFEDFRSFHRICDVTGGKKGEKVPKWSKTTYILTAVCHRCVKLAWWVHVGMTNSLVALNLEIWEILILFVTSKGKKGVRRDPKLQKIDHIFIRIAQLELKVYSQNVSYLQDIYKTLNVSYLQDIYKTLNVSYLQVSTLIEQLL